MPGNQERGRRTIVFLHIARCGGSTLKNMLDLYFANSRILRASLLHREGNRVEGIAAGSATPVSFNADMERYHCVSGHSNLDDLLTIFPEADYIAMLRDPVKRVVSLYNYWRSHTQSFVEKEKLAGPALARSLSLEEFIESDETVVRFAVRNGMARQLFRGLTSRFEGREEDLLAESIEKIDRFAFVGLTDMFDLSIWLLCETFGWAYPDNLQDANRPTQNLQSTEIFEAVDQTPPPAAVQTRIRELNAIDCALYQHTVQRFGEACFATLGNQREPFRSGRKGSKGKPPLLLKRVANRLIRVLTDYTHPTNM